MITEANYSTEIKSVNISNAPEALQKGHSFYERSNGSAKYPVNDLYLKKLNEWASKQKPVSNTQKAVSKTAGDKVVSKPEEKYVVTSGKKYLSAKPGKFIITDNIEFAYTYSKEDAQAQIKHAESISTNGEEFYIKEYKEAKNPKPAPLKVVKSSAKVIALKFKTGSKVEVINPSKDWLNDYKGAISGTVVKNVAKSTSYLVYVKLENGEEVNLMQDSWKSKSPKSKNLSKAQQLAKQQAELKAYQTQVNNAKEGGLSRAEVVRIARKINETRRLSAQVIDGGVNHSKILEPTFDNLKRWAKEPGKYDLAGVDTKTETTKANKNFKKSYKPTKKTWWDSFWNG